jgi:ATP-binding cassette subfamily F protein uup
MSLLSAEGLGKAYGAKTLLANVTVTLRPNERVGLVGKNGTGKSTLARILAGVEPTDTGSLALRREATVLYLAQDPDLPLDQTARQVTFSGLAAWSAAKNAYDAVAAELETRATDALVARQAELAHTIEHLGGWQRDHEVERILDALGVARIDQTIATMSGGERRRVALARLLVARPDLAVLDEPTNHLDVGAIEWLERFLVEDFGGAVLLVTHDRYLLDRVCVRTLELDNGALYDYDGGYEDYLAAKADRLAHEERTESNRQNFLRRELEWLSRQPKARTTKQKARIERAEAARDQGPRAQEKSLVLDVEQARTGKTILNAEGLDVVIGDRTLVKGLDLFVTEGDRIGIVGNNGTGKTTLLRTLTGAMPASAGKVVIGKNTKIAYLDQMRSGLDPDKTIFENVADQGHIKIGDEDLDPRSYLERFLFTPHDQRKQVGALSGGERARVALAKALRQSVNLLVLDEPTNDLDTATLGALEEMLSVFRGSALIVTHDRWFLDRIATSLLVFEADGRVVHYPGNYETYSRLKKQELQDAKEQPKAPPPKMPSVAPEKSPTKSKVLTFAQKKELETLPARIEEAETRVKTLESTSADPAFYKDGENVKRTLQDLEAARAQVDTLIARWEELETLAAR